MRIEWVVDASHRTWFSECFYDQAGNLRYGVMFVNAGIGSAGDRTLGCEASAGQSTYKWFQILIKMGGPKRTTQQNEEIEGGSQTTTSP